MYFLVTSPNPKGGGHFWTCGKYHIINEKGKGEAIALRGFDYNLFEEKEGGGIEKY